MKYFEIVEKIRNHGTVFTKDITGFQLIMLLQDKEVKKINYHGNIFEVYFIPIPPVFEPYILKEEELPTYQDVKKIIEHWVHCYDAKKPIYVQIEDEYFEIILDLLESV